MKAFLLLFPLLLHAAKAGRGAEAERQGLNDAFFLASLMGNAGGGGTPSKTNTGTLNTGTNTATPSSDQAFLDFLLGPAGGDDGAFGVDPTAKPRCKSASDAAALSDADFLAALQGGCVEEEPLTAEPGTPCERGEFQCTPYHRCLEQDIVSDGLGAFNVRIGLAQFEEESEFITHSECPRFGDVCCASPLSPAPAPLTEASYTPQCGQRRQDGLGARITGFNDSESQFGEFPWMAIVLRVEDFGGEERRLFVCGGSLVHPQMVLTAAHCVDKMKDARLVVRLGEWDKQHVSELYPHVDIAVDGVEVHPKFDARRLRDDVALLLLAEPAQLQPHIDTLCLPTPGVNYDGAQCVATGWGKDAFENGLFQTVLKQIELPHVPRAACQRALRTTQLRRYFHLDRSFTCAGGAAGQDTCTGDGGSPLACRDPLQPDRWVQLGVVSWGIGCGLPGVPGVYADVRRQVNWIGRKAQKVERQQQQRDPDLSLFERKYPLLVQHL